MKKKKNIPLCFALEIVRPESPTRVERMTVHAPKILVGAGAHCDVRIEGTMAGREHVVFELVGGEIRARVRCMRPPPFARGRPLVDGPIANGEEIAVTGTRIRVSAVPAPVPVSKGKTGQMLSTLGLVVALLLLPALVYAALRPPETPSIEPPPAEIASLWDAKHLDASCAGIAKDQALAQAEKLHALGRLQRERYPFAASEGIVAVESFEHAAQCLRTAAEKPDLVEIASSDADLLRKRIEADYRIHRVRLEHALDVEDWKNAQREALALRRLTAGRTGVYVDWLAYVERQVEARLRELKEKNELFGV